MRYPPHILEEIRARLPASAVVGRKVRLKKAGREWRGLSPFNAEKTPSFYVNDGKGRYFDFSAGKDGDIFNFLMETEGLSFPEAVERLAAEAGVELPKASPESERQESRRRSLGEVMELAAAFFEANLRKTSGRAARDYLAGRELTEETGERFRLGFATAERFALRDHLAAKGVDSELMVEAGLLVTGDEVAVPYDRFRDRIMFPIEDARGRVVAFGGRAMRADMPAKYLNSPETPLFSKGRLLYNHHRARVAAHEAGTVVVVEGYVDVIALAQVGIRHAVAPLGTALTEDQVALLWRMAEEPVLCFDGDAAGGRAAGRAIGLALPQLGAGRSLRFATLPAGQDPDDLARRGGRAAVEAVLAASRSLVDALWAREWEGTLADTPEKKAGIAMRLREAVASIRDETLRRFYRDEIETRLRAQGRPASGGGRSGARGGGGRRWTPDEPQRGYLGRAVQVSPKVSAFAGATKAREALIAAVLFAHPELLHGEADLVAGLDLADPDARTICNLLVESVLHGEPAEPTVLEARAERAGASAALERLRARVRAGAGDTWMLEPAADPHRLEAALRQALTLQRKARTLHTEKQAAERALALDQSEATLTWLTQVTDEMLSQDGQDADSERT